MTASDGQGQITRLAFARYVRDLAQELAYQAEKLDLAPLADALDEANVAASIAIADYENDAPEDAA